MALNISDDEDGSSDGSYGMSVAGTNDTQGDGPIDPSSTRSPIEILPPSAIAVSKLHQHQD